MAHYDIFRHHLAIKFPAYGHALWDPDPGNLYPAVEVGDVGYVHEGKFHRLFNALLPAEDESHADFGVPENYEQLQLNLKKHINIGKLSPNNFCSAKVTSMPVSERMAQGPDEIPKVTFSCPMKEGAVLYLPIEATGENTVASADFGKWIIKHIDRWFLWARQLGLGIDRMEDIVLVTGTHRTRSWTNVAFPGGQVYAQASFGAKAGHRGGIVTINWQFSHESSRGAVLNCGPGGENLPEDQCIFIRGFRVTRKLRILPPKLKGAAGPNPDPKGHDEEPNLELIPIPSVPRYRDPLHILLEYIANEALAPSDRDSMLLVHDDDLARLAGDYVYTPLDEVLSLIRVLKPMVHNTRIDLSSARNSASAGIESAWVATLSDIFETRLVALSSTSSAFPSLHVRTPSLRGAGIYTQPLRFAQQPELGPPPQRYVSFPQASCSSAVPRAFAPATLRENAPSTLRENAPDSAQLPSLFGNVTTPGLPFAIPSSYEFFSSHAPEKLDPLAQVSSRSDPPEQSGSTSPISPNNRTNAKVTVYPSYNHGAPRAQRYRDPFGAGYATGNPGFLEPHPWLQSSSTSNSLHQRSSPSGQSVGYHSSASSSVQRSHSGQPTTLYPPSSSSIQHSLTGQSATHYPPPSSAIQHSYIGQSAAHHPVASSVQRSHSDTPTTFYGYNTVTTSSVQRSPSGHSATHYSSASSPVRRNQPATLYAPSISSVQHNSTGQSAAHSPLLSSAVQHSYTGQSTAYYPPTFEATNTSHPEPQPTSHHHVVPHRYGTNTSDDSRSNNRLYQTAAPLTHVTPDPPYRGTQPQESGAAQPQYRDAYEYENVDEHRPRSPGLSPVQGRLYNCRLPECNRPMFFDRRLNEFWEWCSPQHIHAGLGRRIEKTCRHCGIWPRKYGHKYCGGASCNKKGVPIPSY